MPKMVQVGPSVKKLMSNKKIGGRWHCNEVCNLGNNRFAACGETEISPSPSHSPPSPSHSPYWVTGIWFGFWVTGIL